MTDCSLITDFGTRKIKVQNMYSNQWRGPKMNPPKIPIREQSPSRISGPMKRPVAKDCP